MSLASLSCLACLHLVFFFDSLLSLVCLLWLVALCVCVCVDLFPINTIFFECLCCHVFYLPCAPLLRSHECAHGAFAMCRLVTSPQKGARQIRYIAIDHHCCNRSPLFFGNHYFLFFSQKKSEVCMVQHSPCAHLSHVLKRAHGKCNTSQVNRQITSVAFGDVCYMLFFLSHDFVSFLSFTLLFFSVLCFCK